ncbi:hypothetical protein QQP08_010701 [Theobroma cacao]|nr:hypothetical protein QQP08_010701 [Theobroma cacao]
MHRSSSGSRVADEFFINSTPSESQSSKQQSSETVSLIPQQLPTYNPLSYAAKKERSRIRFAENAIHIIPLVLILCAIILWFFSSPGMTTLSRTEQTSGSSHCKSDPTRFARMVIGKIRGHLSSPYALRAPSMDSGPDLIPSASFLVRITASSKAQQAPCPRLGVIGCQASPSSTTLPADAGGLIPGHSQRSTRGALLIVSSGVRSINLSSSGGQFFISSFASFFSKIGSVIFGPETSQVLHH